jgi:antitoxin component HigA of HigAB toxin-antitoxin module
MAPNTTITLAAEHEAALRRIDELLDIYPFGNPEDEKELERISDWVIAYEDIHYPIDWA